MLNIKFANIEVPTGKKVFGIIEKLYKKNQIQQLI